MNPCWFCRNEVKAEELFTIKGTTHQIPLHSKCASDFASLVRETLAASGSLRPAVGLDRLARRVGDTIVVVHRNFPNDQVPLLVYLAHFDEPVAVLELYRWLRESELSITNPSLALLRLSKKGLATTFKREGTRYAMITDEGKRSLYEYAGKLSES